MLNLNEIAPYIRFAMYSRLVGPFSIRMRALFDYELLLIADGECDIIYDGRLYDCKKDDVLLFCPGHRHEFIVKDKQFIYQPHIHFDMAYDADSERVSISYKDLPQFTNEEKKLIRNDVFADCRRDSPFLKIGDLEYFKRIFFDVIDTYNSKSAYYPLTCKQQFLKVLEYIIGENFAGDVLPPQSQLSDSSAISASMRMVLEYVQNNAEKKLSLKSVAAYFNYSECYLDRKFKHHFGFSIMKLYHSLRVELAKTKLKQNISVTEIADYLSFPSIYAFSRFFKSQTGQSPSDYRKAEGAKRPQ